MGRESIQRLLNRYLDGELSPDEESVVERALENDPDLRLEREEHTRIRQTLRADERPRPSADLAERVAERVLAGPPASTNGFRPALQRVAATLLAVVVIGGGSWLVLRDPGQVWADVNARQEHEARIRKSWAAYGLEPATVDRILQIHVDYRLQRESAQKPEERRRLDDLEAAMILKLLSPSQRQQYASDNHLSAKEMESLLQLTRGR